MDSQDVILRKTRALQEMFPDERGNIQSRNGTLSLALGFKASDLTRVLDALGLKGGEDYSVVNSRAGAIEINSAKLPDPGANAGAYSNFAKLLRLAAQDGVVGNLALQREGDNQGKISGTFGGLDVSRFAEDLRKLGVKEQDFTIKNEKAGFIVIDTSRIKLPEDAKTMLDKLKSLEDSTGLQWNFDQSTQTYRQSGQLTKEQVNKIADLDGKAATRPVYEALIGQGTPGGDFREVANNPNNKITLQFKPEELSAEVLNVLQRNSGVIKKALGADDERAMGTIRVTPESLRDFVTSNQGTYDKKTQFEEPGAPVGGVSVRSPSGRGAA